MQSYKTFGTHIVHQNIEGEVIVIDLTKGLYFSLNGPSVIIWEQIFQGFSLDVIEQKLFEQYDAPMTDIKNAVDSVIKELLREELIALDLNAEKNRSGNSIKRDSETSTLQKKFFELLPIQKYSDLEEVLVLDPIHDVDEHGWPNAR